MKKPGILQNRYQYKCQDRSLYFFCTVALLLFFVSGCSSNSIYRNLFELCEYSDANSCSQSALQVHDLDGRDEYRLGFVEYDDQGQLRERAQMDAVVDEYLRIAGSDDDVLLVAFVHGWHHNASPGDDNIKSFRRMLTEISRNELKSSQQQDRARRKVLGLYVGWRGESITVPYVKDLTFWDRKNTAHDVGQQGIAEVLLKFEEIVNVKAGIEEENPPPLNSRLVIIGHSFGGAVVYTSLQNVLADRFVGSRRGKTFSGSAEGFGDLVVLINPAFEAIRFAGLYDLSQEKCRGYFPGQVPKLAIMTSEADYATKLAFPAGRMFSTLFEAHKTLEDRHYCSKPGTEGMQALRVDEGVADRNTVGHFTPYLTHRLNPSEVLAARQADYQVNQIQEVWAEQTRADTLDFNGSQLVSLGRTTPLNPYLNIQVDKTLIKDHNDIWRPEIMHFISEMIILSATPTEGEAK